MREQRFRRLFGWLMILLCFAILCFSIAGYRAAAWLTWAAAVLIGLAGRHWWRDP
jgi:hypothetical protein